MFFVVCCGSNEEPLAICRYAISTYKPHFACFRCRKSFRRRLKREVDPAGPDRPAKCPQCGLLMADIGLDFKPPRTSDAKAWALALEAVELRHHVPLLRLLGPRLPSAGGA